ncbi:hypothetical protein SLEP1_g20086 [Rubroshorea leprosula]|uniref:Uncharacterized protein n=1 Tax=Rubroshorea leprosula TaxID=152421 RepID=A0AAV5J1J5_9ROSI|nr:hypothetical protein SLEP1_g20086 [Rubroshorea leprosula]
MEPPLQLDPTDLLVYEDIFDDPLAASHLPPLISRTIVNPIDSSDLSYCTRFLLHHPSDSMGLSGLSSSCNPSELKFGDVADAVHL